MFLFLLSADPDPPPTLCLDALSFPLSPFTLFTIFFCSLAPTPPPLLLLLLPPPPPPAPPPFTASTEVFRFIRFKKSAAALLFLSAPPSALLFSGLRLSDGLLPEDPALGVELEESFLLLRFLLLLLRLLTPVTGFSLALGGSSSSVSEEGFVGGFESEGALSFLSLKMGWSFFWPKVVEEGFANIELRLRQTNMGPEALFLDKRESGLASGMFGGSESLFRGIGSDCVWAWFFISVVTRRCSCRAACDSGESWGKMTVALVKRRRRSRKNALVHEKY
ncbi:hypothetical protein V8G54_025759 [Vigna mungo]|uniref:Uncharacterized protein n=1 Tax=Vigna mungo TaxID=3915 RepID=A0AAQ3MZL0_VIGMU